MCYTVGMVLAQFVPEESSWLPWTVLGVFLLGLVLLCGWPLARWLLRLLWAWFTLPWVITRCLEAITRRLDLLRHENQTGGKDINWRLDRLLEAWRDDEADRGPTV